MAALKKVQVMLVHQTMKNFCRAVNKTSQIGLKIFFAMCNLCVIKFANLLIITEHFSSIFSS